MTHSINSGGVAAVRWYQLSLGVVTPPALPFSFGTFENPSDNTSRWLSSAALDGVSGESGRPSLISCHSCLRRAVPCNSGEGGPGHMLGSGMNHVWCLPAAFSPMG